MKFGLFFLAEKPPGISDADVYSNILEQCRVADELGYDAVWLAEHHLAPYGTIPDTLTFAAAVAQVTKKIRIGTAVIIPAFHHPLLLAEQIAMVDLMSEGRFDLGVGRGYQIREFKALGIPQEESRARFQESLEILEGLLTKENFSFEGKFWSVEDVTIYPRPVQQPMPPIYVAVIRSPESFKFIAERGYDALVGNPYQVDPELNEALELYKAAMRDAGKARGSENIWVLTNGFVHEDLEFAQDYPRKSVELGIDYVLKYSKPLEEGQEIPEDYKHYADWFSRQRRIPYEEMVKLDTALFGTPDLVAERLLKMHQEAGWDNFILTLNRGGWMEQKEVLKSMELFAKKVMPEVKKQAATV
jgi:alkanesulfonate monooxygenase SsuD/methylene tetrahydromethanopterin reductase-like flavin-dependent oxidoreductase (luciferase family)